MSGVMGALTAAVFTGVGEVVKAVRGSSNSPAKGSSQVSNEQSKQGGGRTPNTRLPGKTIDQATGQEVGRFIVDPKGNVMIEPIGGSTVPAGRGGVDTHTLYPNGSNYQRLNPIGHGNNPSAHGHGHLMGSGFGMKGQGPSIDIFGNIVPWSSASAHWPINK